MRGRQEGYWFVTCAASAYLLVSYGVSPPIPDCSNHKVDLNNILRLVVPWQSLTTLCHVADVARTPELISTENGGVYGIGQSPATGR